MSKNMLIDSAHAEEVRVAVVNDGKLDRFDFDAPSKNQVKGNIYLAKVIRVEPSLQAAFVDYGGNRHGFLSFSEIHHDYFQIPVDDRQQLEEHIHNAIAARAAELGEAEEELDPKEVSKLRYQFYRRYKIQEVIKKRQIMLVQVVKEERGNKGAALTTYISLAGRYCVLMPNTSKGSGVSRKIVNRNDRAKLKKIVAGLQIENGSVVIRTAGIGHTKAEIRKDFDYLVNQWKEIREITIQSTAPSMIYEEASIIKRAIRDMYSRDIEAIFVEGAEAYKTAKAFVKKLMPSHAKKVKLYDDQTQPLFAKFKVNDQINQIYSPRVDLPSGGYLVINTTEALISIDVNSGKATRERNVAGTALKTNLEAAVEIARQCRLRDLAGLLVVDFIDMEEKRNNTQVERCLRDALRSDKAKIQVGAISNFGLLEFSRQRLRSSIADANMIICPHCNGTGFMRSIESIAIQVLRRIEEVSLALNAREVRVTLSPEVALYIMNNKRAFLSGVESRSDARITFTIDSTMIDADFKIEQIMRSVSPADEYDNDDEEESAPVANERKEKKKVPSRKKTKIKEVVSEVVEEMPQIETEEMATSTEAKSKRRRKGPRHKKTGKAKEAVEIKVEDKQPEEKSQPSEEVKSTEEKKSKAKTPRRRSLKSSRSEEKTEENSHSTKDEYPSVEFSPEQQAIVSDAIEAQRMYEESLTKFPVKKIAKKKSGWWQKLLKKPADSE
ncbi:MAG: Rne/Rng family ribonuclease [Alphaproteobacteria bacterium]|nr:Rne/Rng family ribonuclease [Alphaproteobacteria bacterium]